LEDHGDAALGRRQGGDVAAADDDTPLIRRLEPGDQAQRRRLAAAPDGPSKTSSEPAAVAKLTRSTARVSPQSLLTPSTEIAAKCYPPRRRRRRRQYRGGR
jgi:hypothetical protein